ncbi:MAG: PaaI family thioesterase [Acidobacteriota bacterium]
MTDTTRTTTWDDPHELGRLARELPGLEYMRHLIEAQRRVPIGVTLGFTLVEVAEGMAVFEAEAGPWAYNPIGTVHGGWYAAVLDAPLGVALHTTLPKGVGYTTLELKVNLVRPVQPDTGVLRAVGRVVHRGRRTAVTEARMEDAGGRLYAHATSTCLILEG